MAIAINGSGTLTGVSVGGLPDGIVDTDMLAANAVTAAKATGSAKGITMVDQWRITSDFTLRTSAAIMSGWERNDTSGYEGIGTGMTESSGVFTFPTTGIYLVTFIGTSHGNSGASLAITAQIQTQKNSGAWITKTSSQESAYTTNAYGSMIGQTVFNVEDTSGDKLRMRVYAANSSRYFLGDTDFHRTGLTFMRLGDT